MSDDILSFIKDTVLRIEAKQDKHDDRIRAVESWQNNTDGKITAYGVVGVLIGAAITWVSEFWKN